MWIEIYLAFSREILYLASDSNLMIYDLSGHKYPYESKEIPLYYKDDILSLDLLTSKHLI